MTLLKLSGQTFHRAPHAYLADALAAGPVAETNAMIVGRVTLVLDDSEVDLAAGDVVIQRGTNHAWSNRGPGICHAVSGPF